MFRVAYEGFVDALFFAVSQNNSIPTHQQYYDQNPFLTRIIGTYERINTSLNTPAFLETLFENEIKQLMENRIDLARLDENISAQQGLRGNRSLNNDQNLQNALNSITGRIFEVQIDVQDNRTFTSQLVSSSSGTLVHWNNNQINNINSNVVQQLVHVLTCAHALSSDNNRSEYYFVRSENLNRATGWPPNMRSETGLINYLRTNDNSYKLGTFTIINRVTNNFETIALSMGQPLYDSDREDVVIAHIVLRPNQNPPQYQNVYAVQFGNHLPAVNSDYYALGYPGCDQYSVADQSQFVQANGLYPLFITRTQHTNNGQITQSNGKLAHKAPTSQGMSGGPLFYLSPNNISIFGVITGGLLNNEVGCYWY